ncbi:hypothetical protein [Sphingomonas sp. Leaf10]|uniref:hypothetical protein n=1 Tax=Sphingomonas sp. Leaf10 TaxID=1735676 RepID=UPI0006F54DAD|nr:hypothetical protein [Sphingomonas sp. Leaf10]KQM38169.1 hypothetical protein ASE59_12895 [Sphingomonas sp. Leaf10]
MKTLLTKAGLGLPLAVTALTAAAPAEAQWRRGYDRGWDRGYDRGWDRGWNRNRGNGGAAVVAGIAGLAIGAALASSANDRRYRDRYYRDRGYAYDYDDRFYRQRGFYPNDGYYAYRYNDYRRCWVEQRYDPYYDQDVRVRVCN